MCDCAPPTACVVCGGEVCPECEASRMVTYCSSCNYDANPDPDLIPDLYSSPSPYKSDPGPNPDLNPSPIALSLTTGHVLELRRSLLWRSRRLRLRLCRQVSELRPAHSAPCAPPLLRPLCAPASTSPSLVPRLTSPHLASPRPLRPAQLRDRLRRMRPADDAGLHSLRRALPRP